MDYCPLFEGVGVAHCDLHDCHYDLEELWACHDVFVICVF